ncbi:MAG: carboxypeptidase-like regulatory domain-containing protein [Bryobacteraceae bacterium]
MTGTLKDPSGAVVPRAQLTLTNHPTGFAQKARSSSTGAYVFASAPVGSYTLKVEASGFKASVAREGGCEHAADHDDAEAQKRPRRGDHCLRHRGYPAPVE